ncbi:MAG: hypothetical protein KJN71_09510 [Acidimicrobiia bacterium]|nr:hypothetical protein [Acidimicrobiia bacterium]
MAITIDYSDQTPQYVIYVPKADTTLVQTTPTEIRSLNINNFWRTLADLQDDVPGVWAPTAYIHTPPLTVAGVTLARVVEILDPYVIEFEDGSWSVNITGGNSNIADVTVKNQVGVNTANSAGLQDPFALQAAGFSSTGAVALDITSPYSGTTFPIGTRSNPVNNLADAKAIADVRGLYTINVMSSMTINAGTNMSQGYEFYADSPVTVTITIDPSIDVQNCKFTNATITGTLDGDNTFDRCEIQNVNFFNGTITNCSLSGTITLGGGQQAEIYDSWSAIAGGGAGQTPTIDMGGTGQDLLMRNYSGGIEIINCTDATAEASIDMNSGRVVFDPTISDGTFWVRGVSDVYDATTGSATVFDQTSSVRAAEAVWDSVVADHQSVGTFGKAIQQIKNAAHAALGIGG